MHQISDTIERKFVDSVSTSDWEIETESGWVDITHINKTVPYKVWILETGSGKRIECADNHIVFRENDDQVFVKDLSIGDHIKGHPEIEKVSALYETNREENMYDLTVAGNHTFYAEGLLHHNTTVSAAFFVWFALFHDSKSIGIVANKQAIADEIMSKIRLMVENVPKWMQRGIVTFNKRRLEFENGSKIFGAATSSSGLRGMALQILYLDEFAFVENNLADDFFTSVYPTITAGKDTKVFMTSTPNGFNHFHKFWDEAEKGINGFVPLRVHWYETPGRDQKWYDEQKAVLGELKSSQELDAEFLGSSKQLLTAATMSRLSSKIPIQTLTGNYTGVLIYELPQKGHHYLMIVDVSRGRHLDSSAFLIVDVTDYPHRIVASYNNCDIPPMRYALLLQHFGSHYNTAYMLIEINDIGGQVADILWNEYEYGEMFWTKGGMILGKTGADPYPGVRTTKTTKRIGCANLKDIIEKEQFIVDDYTMIKELSTFIQNKTGSYEADEGYHDDMVMCGVLYAWIITQPFFKDIWDKDIRNKMYLDEEARIENELLPFFESNGNDYWAEQEGERFSPELLH